MDGILKLAATVLAARRALDRAGTVARKGAAALALAVIALTLLLAALGCGVAALWIYLLPLLGPVGTAAAAAVLFLVLAVVLLLVARFLLRQPARPAAPPPSLDAVGIAAIADLIAKHKGTTLLAAVVAGLVAGTQQRR